MLKNFASKLLLALMLTFTASCATVASSPSPVPSAPQDPEICGQIPTKTLQQKTFEKDFDLYVEGLLIEYLTHGHYEGRARELRLQSIILSCRAALGDESARVKLQAIEAAVAAVRSAADAQLRDDDASEGAALAEDAFVIEGADEAF